MPRATEIGNVPKARVPTLIKGLLPTAKRITLKKQGNGRWKIRAT